MASLESVGKAIWSFVKANLLLVLILVAILVGFGIGFAFRESAWYGTDNVLWFTLPGTLFIRSLQLLIIPVIFIGVVNATSAFSAKENLRITLICLAFCFSTHVLACLIGVFGGLILVAASDRKPDPAVAGGATTPLVPVPNKGAYDIAADLLRNLIPSNIFKATTNQDLTRYVKKRYNETFVLEEYERQVQSVDGTNILGILFFALLIGLSASVNHEKAKAFREFIVSLNDIVISILRWLIMFAPIGIASLIIEAVLDIEDFGESFKQIGLFAGICCGALIFYTVVCLTLLLVIFLRTNPLKYYFFFAEPMLLAFASTSGAVCISKCLTICETKVKMDNRLAKFTIPFYITLHADGSAIFITLACIFLANFNGITFNAGEYAIIIITTSFLCLSLPSVPSSSIVTILVVLNSFNLSYLNIAILYTVEWLLDRVRTAVNLYSHCFLSVITAELCKNRVSVVPEVAAIDDEGVKEEKSLREAEQQDGGSAINASLKSLRGENTKSSPVEEFEIQEVNF